MANRISKVLIIATIGVTIWMLSMRFQLGLTRYFDVDEYAYLHWAYQVFSGNVPYRDFFFYAPPGFLWALAPLFAFFHGTAPFLAGRVLAVAIFSALSLIAGLLFWQVRRSWAALLVPLILIFLPLPSDKFLEIRPDTFAMLFAMVGLLFQVKWMRSATKGSAFRGWSFLSGFFYSLSFLVLPKTLPQVAVAVVIAVGWGIWGRKRIMPFFIGLFVPIGLFGLWAIGTGDPGIVWYSLLQLPREVGNETAKMFPMQPDLFFYPNATYYGENGWSIGLLVNHAIWIVGLAIGALRLLTPKTWTEFLISASLFAHVIFFFWIYPLRHAQYLIPIAVFVAWYAADFINILWYKGLNKFPTGILITLLVGGCAGLLWIFLRVNQPKLAWDNKAPLVAIGNLYAAIPFSEYLLDLDGRTIYYQDPYYICCLPYGEFTSYMSRKLPSLIPILEQTNTQYIYEGELLRVNTLPPDEKNYIRTNYAPYPNIPGLLLRK